MPERNEWADSYAKKFTPWDSGIPSRELVRVLDEYSMKPCRTLEPGCGTGTNAIYLAQRGFEVTAFDLVQQAIDEARKKATGVSIKLFQGNISSLPDLSPQFDFVFDRGVYHSVREDHLKDFCDMLAKNTRPGSMYLTLCGNSNDTLPPGMGPRRVSAVEICSELSGLFEIVHLREFYFDGIVIEGQQINSLGWSVLSRRRKI